MKYIIISLALIMSLSACKNEHNEQAPKDTPEPMAQVEDWAGQAVIYEVNIRQYTPEGTFKAFEAHLPRLKELGVNILWLMPIHPIGVERRKGELGSFYSVKDYKGINPNFGTVTELRSLINSAQAMGFKFIMDWVPNHSAFDNQWAIDHPEWYTQNEQGEIIHPEGTDWTDVADFNYDNQDMRAAMIDAMAYWVREFGIDGYRCDVAGFVPYDFWKDAIDSLNTIKPVFMLAEWEDEKLNDVGFHATYGWEMHHIMNEIAKGHKVPMAMDSFMQRDLARFPEGAYRMNFTTNHDENSWNGTIKERMGAAGDVMNVLAFTIQGMPLVYSGQEAGLDKRLSFFGKDEIDWSDLSKQDFYKTLIQVKHSNEALQNGLGESNYQPIETNNANVLAYQRAYNGEMIVAFLNLSSTAQSFQFSGEFPAGDFEEVFTKDKQAIQTMVGETMSLGAWGYHLFSKEK